MRIGADGTKLKGCVEFEVDTGEAVILFTVHVEDEEQFRQLVDQAFKEARNGR